MAKIQGRLLQCNGGFYYVEAAGAVYECRARGVFRKQGMTPLAGDMVCIEPQGDAVGTLTDILPRKNALIRPPLANLDILFIAMASASPAPLLSTVDKLIFIAEFNNIEPVIVIGKSELDPAKTSSIADIYRTAGFTVFTLSALHGDGVDEISN